MGTFCEMFLESWNTLKEEINVEEIPVEQIIAEFLKGWKLKTGYLLAMNTIKQRESLLRPLLTLKFGTSILT